MNTRPTTKTTRLAGALSLLVLPGFVACHGGPAPFREGVHATDELFPGSARAEGGDLVSRVVDDLTGAPLAGAEVLLVDEHKTPIAGEFWFLRRYVTDADGFVRFEGLGKDAWRGWHVVRHASCGVASRMGGEEIWRVGRAFDVPVHVTDWCGRPAAGALVGFCGGCGHTPDLVNATTDANGDAVLRAIDPRNGIADIYVQQPGLHYFYNSVDWRPGEAPREVSCGYAPPMSGRVVDHLGRPVAGAYVDGGSQHRGPWGRTAADGTFTILGSLQPACPHHVVTPEGRDIYFDTSRAWPVTLRLPDLADEKAYEGRVEDEPKAPEPVPVRAVRVVVEGAPGEVEVGSFAPGMAEADEPAAGHVLVPARGPFVVRASPAGSKIVVDRLYPFADGANVADPIVVKWKPDVRLVGRAVDAAGRPVAAAVRVRARWSAGDASDERDEQAPLACADGAFDLPVTEHGTVLLEVAPSDASLRPRLQWLVVPERGIAERIDVGAVVVGGAPRVRVVDTNGAPLPKAIVGFVRPGWQHAEQVRRWPLAADGTWRGPDLRAGDVIVVQRDEDALPFRTVITGDELLTIVAPNGQLDIAIADDARAGAHTDAGADEGEGEDEGEAEGARKPLKAVVVVADHAVDSERGVVSLRGLPTGPTRCYVSAPGHRSLIVDAMITASPQAIRVELPRR